MVTIRTSGERGHLNFGWLDTYHTFSFGDYYDPAHMGFRALRVINDDRVAPGMGFDTHPHKDMEIITYVLEGALAHRDSLGSQGVIRPGEVQVMTAGRGIRHSEFNASKTEQVHLLQIWIKPRAAGLEPAYAQKEFPREKRLNRLQAVASPDERDGSLKINQDAVVYASILEKGKSVEHALAAGRHAWVQVARGDVEVNGVRLGAGDGVSVSDEKALEIAGAAESELLLFELA